MLIQEKKEKKRKDEDEDENKEKAFSRYASTTRSWLQEIRGRLLIMGRVGNERTVVSVKRFFVQLPVVHRRGVSKVDHFV